MKDLLRAMFGIALLRQDPSVLPSSLVLVVLTGAFYAVASVLDTWLVTGGDRWFGRMLVDLVPALALFWFLLAATGRGHRYRQTIAAVFGTAVLLAPLAIGLQWLLQYGGAVYLVKLLAWSALVAVAVWSLVIVGHILRSALEIGYLTSIALALTWLIGTQALKLRLFSAAAA